MASHAGRLLLLLALAAALAGRSEGAWCVCRTDLPDATLQRTLDYACGSAADCKPIQPNAACFAPDTVKAHCSYAVNSYYQRSGQNSLACVFSGTAVVSSVDPSTNGCKYPATPSAPDSPPPPMAQGPNGKDTSGGADVLPVAGTATRAVILACCSLLALYLMA
ncbi:hypothetical protein CFC21_073586 [Triticum aestivum]|uniref:X8 domain-containing protein n=3 Tax=Triticum TaxID=4564 RepID=A0A9R1AQW6_TRITD|nr:PLASMODESMATA CALLOSE-BINDING PROTEIN 2-like isoform X2 [Triticum dicoccoides]XP_044393786.1 PLASMODESMATA CALLOSE-BINDING PROTEIN 2-like isoform X2 [Triticum aestivum]KAF7067741.1 hypothetical protein CFC21_073586 [Triticum aestivum]VAI36875.1 unnamed protein product [Triticum turgidum subsp. durum]